MAIMRGKLYVERKPRCLCGQYTRASSSRSAMEPPHAAHAGSVGQAIDISLVVKTLNEDPYQPRL